MSKHQHIAFFQIGLNILLIQCRLLFIIDQDHDDISLFCSLCRSEYFEALLFGSFPGPGSLIQTDDNIAAGLFQIKRMGVSLTSVTDDRNGLSLQIREITVFLIKNSC